MTAAEETGEKAREEVKEGATAVERVVKGSEVKLTTRGAESGAKSVMDQQIKIIL